MRRFGLWIRAVLAAVLCCALLLPAAQSALETHETTVLFTHDLHSHFFPQRTGEGETGGYARLKTALDRERALHPDALVLDGGDFSVGSLIQTLYTTKAAELRTMGALGYDATTAGNHEFDHTGEGFARMLTAALNSGDRVPALLMANYRPDAENPSRLDIQRAMAAYGAQECMVLERGGVTYGLFGLMGQDSHDSAPASGFALEDPVRAAQRCVRLLQEQGAQFIICLSHSGTNEKQKLSEDEQLAKHVAGIDLIISGHTHTTLEEPIVVGDTYIVSAGPYCENLGSITLRWSGWGENKVLEDYRLVPIDQTLPQDGEIQAMVEGWKEQVDMGYLSAYGLSCDQVLTHTGFDLKKPAYGVQEPNALGELVSDSYLWAVEHLEGDSPQVPTVAVTADGVLRASLNAGPITTAQAFDVLSLGVGEDGRDGYPLVSCYLTGKELKVLLEIDASLTPLMPSAQLYLSGIRYSFNTHRMFFNRVTRAGLESGDASGEVEIEDKQIYRVVTGLYCAQMFNAARDKSMGLLSLEPKNERGELVTDFSQQILRDQNGDEIKEWYALAAYLEQFGQEGVPRRYAGSDGRKVVSQSLNPIQLLVNLNWITLAVLAAAALAAAVIVMLTRYFLGRRRGRGYRRRRLF